MATVRGAFPRTVKVEPDIFKMVVNSEEEYRQATGVARARRQLYRAIFKYFEEATRVGYAANVFDIHHLSQVAEQQAEYIHPIFHIARDLGIDPNAPDEDEAV